MQQEALSSGSGKYRPQQLKPDMHVALDSHRHGGVPQPWGPMALDGPSSTSTCVKKASCTHRRSDSSAWT